MKKIKEKLLKITYGKTILQVVLVGLLSGLIAVIFKACINNLFFFIQKIVSNLPIVQKIIT